MLDAQNLKCQLPADLATAQYAIFLETINQPELRPHCLQLATEAGEHEILIFSHRNPYQLTLLEINLIFVCIGLDVAAITKLVVETVREWDETEFTHHNQTLESGTTKVKINK